MGGNKDCTDKGSGSIRYVKNRKGPILGYSVESGVKILEEDGCFFKDLNKNGKIEKYEDWRLSPEERARDLASRLSIEQIAGLMLYSRHQAIPAAGGWFGGTYEGKPFAESGAAPWDLTDQQIEFLTRDHLRHVLVIRVESPEVAARWNNKLQALVEGLDFGIPANNSSDPRHGADSKAEYNAGAGGDISQWSEPIGLAASFDPELVEEFGQIASKEYRALGITTALSPQVDIATDPRWSRVKGTFGEDPKLSADMARAYIDGFQSSYGDSEISDGWGYDSVNTMVKHWPGGGSGEGGRDAHFGYGKYAVYPGDNFQTHLIPFIKGAFDLNGKTGKASAVMPYYTISFNRDTKNGENVGNAYSSYIINDLLRKKYGYDGVVCTDWGITDDESPDITSPQGGGRCWGVEEGYTVAERHYKIIMAGVDQFGGNNEITPILDAYQIGVEKHGEAFMRRRFEESAVRLLVNMFRVGLFENPYLDVEKSVETVGNPEFMKKGYEAQLKSIVLLKNKGNVVPLAKGTTVYIPKRYIAPGRDWFGRPTPESYDYPVNMDLVCKYFNVTDNPEEADVGLVFVESPNPGIGYSKEDVAAGGNGYIPMTLQYGPYKATEARAVSIAGDHREKDVLNRSYKDKTVTASNSSDLDMIRKTVAEMKGKPVIVSILMSNPMVFHEFEREVDGIIVNFGVQDQAILDCLSGKSEPSGLLPMQMPADMKTVEEQYEDVPRDMRCHVDSEGNVYDFAFGLNWKGVISDARTKKYK
jgi:beta-glucosidase